MSRLKAAIRKQDQKEKDLVELDRFNQIVEEYQDMVYHQAYRMLGEPQAAEDATQEAFWLAYRKFGSYRGGSLKAWLLRIVTNCCYDELRRWQRHPITALEPVDANGEEMESLAWMADPAEPPEVQVERVELGKKLQDCLEQLPVMHRALLILVDLQGLSYIEAAEVMGVSLGTIKSRLSRARLRFRETFERVEASEMKADLIAAGAGKTGPSSEQAGASEENLWTDKSARFAAPNARRKSHSRMQFGRGV